MTSPAAASSPPLDASPASPCQPALGAGASWAEQSGRLVIALCLVTLLFVLWTPRLEAAAGWTAKELRVLPRMSFFVLSALVALIVQGARPSRAVLLGGGLLCAAAALCLLPWAELWQLPVPVPKPGAAAADVAVEATDRRIMLLAGPVLQLLRLQVSLLAAILLGTWLGRRIQASSHLVAMLCCAIAGDVWLNTFHVPDAAAATHPLRLLRLPWPPPLGHLGPGPACTDLLFLSATIEAARGLRFHMLSVVLGAVSGYCAGSFLGLDPWPAWPALSMALFTSGVLVGCWPELKCSFQDTGKALLLGALLLAALLALASLQRALTPPPEPSPSFARHRYVT